MTSGAAVRVDTDTGAEERLELLPTPRGNLYTWSARPSGAETGVVVCSSVFGDFTANYHRERQFGRMLSARGHGVVRFHYAGEGNSGGERSEMTFETLCADAAVAVEHARSAGFSRIGLLGTRAGAAVAAATAATLPASAALAWWEPLSDPLRFLTEGQRAERMSQATQGTGKREGWRQQLDRDGVVHLLGYDVYAPMVASLENLDLMELLGKEIRPIFLARFRSRDGDDPDLQALLASGFSPQFGDFGVTESWWFHSEKTPETGSLVTATVDWMSERLEEML